MSETSMEWIKIIAPLLSGGVMGALVTAFVTNRRNRIQSVGTSVVHESLLAPGKLLKDHVTKITLSGPSGDYHYDNLHLLQIEVQNSGNKDYSDFNFGITLPDKAQIVSLQGNGADRHHTFATDIEAQLALPANCIDIRLKPFNRKDSYKITLYATTESDIDVSRVSFSSEVPVNFKDLRTISYSRISLFVENSPIQYFALIIAFTITLLTILKLISEWLIK